MHDPMHSLVTFFVVLLSGLIAVAPLSAAEPGRGLTADIETDYLKFIIDHHFSALRITECAAGTDLKRDAQISSDEGTSPSPGAPETKAKAWLDELTSMARVTTAAARRDPHSAGISARLVANYVWFIQEVKINGKTSLSYTSAIC